MFQDGRCNTSPPQLIHTMLPLILSPRHHSLRATSGYHYLVSGTISPPYRGTFQLSLTVLLRYRSWEVFRIRSYCLPHSDPISNGPYSRKKITQKKPHNFHDLRDYHPLRLTHHSRMEFNHKNSQAPNISVSIHHISTHVTMRDSVCSTPLSLAVTHDIA